MKKGVFGRKFKRDKNERKALFKSLLSSLVLQEKIKTTEAKAKAVKGQAEKLVTRVAKNSTHNISFLQEYLTTDAMKKMVSDIAPRFKNRPGGYLRLIRIGRRLADNAPMVIMEWVEGSVAIVKTEVKASQKEKVEATASIKKVKAKKEDKKLTKKVEKKVTKAKK